MESLKAEVERLRAQFIDCQSIVDEREDGLEKNRDRIVASIKFPLT